MIKIQSLCLIIFALNLSVAYTESTEIILEQLESYQQEVEKALINPDVVKLRTLMIDEMADEWIEDISEDGVQITQAEIYFYESTILIKENELQVVGLSILNGFAKESEESFHEEQKLLFTFSVNNGVLKLEKLQGVKNMFMKSVSLAGRQVKKYYDEGQIDKIKPYLIDQGASEKDVEGFMKAISENPQLKVDGLARKREGTELTFKVDGEKQNILFPWNDE